MTAEETARARAKAKLRKSLTILAYVSLAFDVCIPIVPSVGALKVGDLQSVLVPVNYALTAVVVLSAIVFVALVVEKVTRIRGFAKNPRTALKPLNTTITER
jgi:hypothetical protein